MRILSFFRRSLFVKVFTISSITSIALIYFLGSNPYNRISGGIINDKIAASISEGESAIQYANYRFVIADLNRTRDLSPLVEEIVNSSNVSAKDSGREVAFINSAGDKRGDIPAVSTSNFLKEESIPTKFRERVKKRHRRSHN